MSRMGSAAYREQRAQQARRTGPRRPRRVVRHDGPVHVAADQAALFPWLSRKLGLSR